MASKSRWSITNLFKLKDIPQPAPQARSANPYHAVSINPGGGACASAHRFAGQRFLSRQAPRLPLPKCDVAVCECRFKHHEDRRVGPRRRADVGFMPGTFNGMERRQSRGRRSADRY